MRVVRERAARAGIGRSTEFRWRGTDVSRIEGFSDAALAFAVTLLVVSLEVPGSFQELVWAVERFPAFAFTFAFLVGIWFFHYHFFRRYGLEDGVTIVLNAILLFVVLFYVYPLKFLFTFLGYVFLGLGGPDARALAADPTHDGRAMMTIYGVGFVAVFSAFFLLYLHAWRKRDVLDLNAWERYDTVTSLQHLPMYVGVGLVSIAIVQIGGSGASFWSGMAYGVIGPLAATHGIWRDRRRRRVVEGAEEASGETGDGAEGQPAVPDGP